MELRNSPAVLTGEVDLLPFIQDALDEARVRGGGTVILPAGIMGLKPGPSKWLRVGSNVELAGQGESSVIRVMDNVGNYPKLIGPYPNDNAKVENVALRAFRIDQNPEGNHNADVRHRDAAASLAAISIPLFSHVSIVDIAVDPMVGVNGISLNGPGSRDALVTESRFRFVKGRTTLSAGYYDHTAVYLNCSSGRVVHNLIYARALEDRAGAAIEVHGGPEFDVSNNTIDRYNFGVHVVSQSRTQRDSASTSATVRNNVMSEMGGGVLLWALTGRTVRDVKVQDNAISINNAVRAARFTSGDGVIAVQGIGFVNDSASTQLRGRFENISIARNVVVFQRAVRESPFAYSDSWGVGGQPQGEIYDVHLENNVVVGPPVTGVKVAPFGGATRVTVDRNTIIDAGSDTGVQPERLRAAIYIDRQAQDLQVTGNVIIDTSGLASSTFSLFVNESGRYADLVIGGNVESARRGVFRRQVPSGSSGR